MKVGQRHRRRLEISQHLAPALFCAPIAAHCSGVAPDQRHGAPRHRAGRRLPDSSSGSVPLPCCRVVVGVPMTLAGVPASGGWCVDGVNIDVNGHGHGHGCALFVVILCRTCMSVILTCMPLTCLAVLDTHVKFTDMDVHARTRARL